MVPGKSAYPVGKIALEMVFGDDYDSRSETLTFEVVKIRSPYHALFGRSVYAKFVARSCYVYLQLKMSGHKGTITVHGSRKIALEFFNDYAAWGGARVSWTAPIYILEANFAEHMPQDEDWIPVNGNPHPLPGVPFLELPQFVLPPYPTLGWNEPPPLEQPAMGDNNWDNAVWGEEEEVQNEAEVEQESMPVVTAAGHEQPVAVDNNIVPDYNPDDWALVVYKPNPPATENGPYMDANFVVEEVIDAQQLFVPDGNTAKVVFGPELPLDMIFRRNFETILHTDICYEIPKPLQVLPLQSALLSKRSRDLAFEVPRLTYYSNEVEHRPVAGTLFPAQENDSSSVCVAE